MTRHNIDISLHGEPYSINLAALEAAGRWDLMIVWPEAGPAETAYAGDVRRMNPWIRDASTVRPALRRFASAHDLRDAWLAGELALFRSDFREPDGELNLPWSGHHLKLAHGCVWLSGTPVHAQEASDGQLLAKGFPVLADRSARTSPRLVGGAK